MGFFMTRRKKFSTIGPSPITFEEFSQILVYIRLYLFLETRTKVCRSSGHFAMLGSFEIHYSL